MQRTVASLIFVFLLGSSIPAVGDSVSSVISSISKVFFCGSRLGADVCASEASCTGSHVGGDIGVSEVSYAGSHSGGDACGSDTSYAGFHRGANVCVLYSAHAGSHSGADGVLINEVLYDPEGPDSGREFVELINIRSEPVCLQAWSLHAGDGARPGSWKRVWQGASGDTLRPGRLFLIAESEVDEADARAKLALQNGPDCCALTFEGLRRDIVGWGEHEHGEYYEGRAALDVSSGHSLARWPDGSDSEDNSADFIDCVRPTPGRRNAREHDLTFGPVPLEIYPINPEAYDRVTVRATVANAGFGAGRSDPFTLRLDVSAVNAGRSVLQMDVPSALAPGDTAVLEAAWEGSGDGAFAIRATLVSEADPDTAGNRAGLLMRVGPGSVVVNEIMYDPDAGGEWIELFNRSSDYLSLAGWSVADKAGGCLTLPAHAMLPPKGHLVVVQDSVGFVRSFPGVSPDSVLGSYGGRWPSLNNSDGTDGVADIVTLTDAGCLLSDRTVYRESLGGGRGISLERVRADLIGGRPDNWCPSGGAGGATPGRSNSVRAAVGQGRGVLSLEPNLIDTRSGAGRAVVNYSLPYRPSRLVLAVYSMNGREVIRLMEREGGSSNGTVLWDGRGSGGEVLAAGAYVMLLVARGEGGQSSTAKVVAVVK